MNKYNSPNLFQNLAFEYQDFISNSNTKLVTSKITKKKKLVTKSIDELKAIELSFSVIEDNLASDNIEQRLSYIKQFIEFLFVAEKCYMYNNSDESCVYSVKDQDTLTLIVSDIDKSVDVSIQFQNSAIKIPESGSSLLGYINGEDNADSTVTFIKIHVNRNFGNKNNTDYKFILGSDLPSSDESDLIMVNNIMNLVGQYILFTTHKIFDNYIPHYINITTNYTFMDVLEGI